MNKKYLLLSIWFIALIGCSEIKEEKVNSTSEEVIVKKSTIKKQKEEDLLEELGFKIEGEKIIIDMNKTTHFFEKLEVKMEKKAEEIESKIEQADINISKGMGIVVEGDTIGIDLNKTRNMMQQINILMKDIFLDINSTKH